MIEPQKTQQESKQRMLPSTIWQGIGVALFLAAIAILLMMIMGPMVGNVFSTINGNLSSFGGDYDSNSPEESGKVGLEVKTERLIIRNGEVIIVVRDPLAAQKAIEQMVAEMANDGAFVVSSNVDGNAFIIPSPVEGGAEEKLPRVRLSIRIPAKQFDKTMDHLTDMAVEVREKTTTAQDVTEEYVDLKARLESLETARQRLLQIMKESTDTESLLNAEKKLTERETEIEAIKGKIQYLSESARLSNIVIEVLPYIAPSEPEVVDTRWHPGETVQRSVNMLINGLKAFADFLIVFSIVILPWLLFLYGIYLLIKRFGARKHQETPETRPKQKS